jgi:hypothetical protein
MRADRITYRSSNYRSSEPRPGAVGLALITEGTLERLSLVRRSPGCQRSRGISAIAAVRKFGTRSENLL